MMYVILGFLLLRELSQYDLVKALKQEVSPFYKASLGSVQSALKKLEKEGFVSVNKIVVNGRAKNIYKISNEGDIVFKEFMLGDINPNKFEAQVSTKLFFLGLLNKNEKLVVVNQVIMTLKSYIQSFEEGAILYKNQKFEKAYANVVKYQFKTLELGIHNHRSNLEWFTYLKEELEATNE